MTQEAIIRFLMDGAWRSTKDIWPYGDANNLQPLVRRGELCKRVLWVPAERKWGGRIVGLKLVKITQYRINPEWYPVFKRMYDE